MFNLVVAVCSFLMATAFAWHLEAVGRGISLLQSTRLAYLVDPGVATASHCLAPAPVSNCRLTVEIRKDSNWADICQLSHKNVAVERFYRVSLHCVSPARLLTKNSPLEISSLLKR